MGPVSKKQRKKPPNPPKKTGITRFVCFLYPWDFNCMCPKLLKFQKGNFHSKKKKKSIVSISY